MQLSTIGIDGATIEFGDVGTGSPIVFVHGVLVTGALWDDVVALVSNTNRCVVPTWLFGAQTQPAGDHVDLSIPASWRRIGKLLEALDLTDVTLVANDTGGGIVLAALSDSDFAWDRVTRLVLTNCDSFENFPPPGFAPMVRLCRFNARAGALALKLMGTGAGQSRFASMVTRHGIEPGRRARIFGGFISSGQVRREAVRFTAGIRPRYTLAAVEAMRAWAKPVLVAWGNCDPLFPIKHAARIAETFPAAELRQIDDAATYVMLDQPKQTAELITEFIRG
jgi:pimeloyl-ACP methyl ester carboxylesterase